MYLMAQCQSKQLCEDKEIQHWDKNYKISQTEMPQMNNTWLKMKNISIDLWEYWTKLGIKVSKFESQSIPTNHTKKLWARCACAGQ
jgi:hypothetical protein